MVGSQLLELRWNTNNRIYIKKGDYEWGPVIGAFTVGIGEFKASFSLGVHSNKSCEIVCKVDGGMSLRRCQQLLSHFQKSLV